MSQNKDILHPVEEKNKLQIVIISTVLCIFQNNILKNLNKSNGKSLELKKNEEILSIDMYFIGKRLHFIYKFHFSHEN